MESMAVFTVTLERTVIRPLAQQLDLIPSGFDVLVMSKAEVRRCHEEHLARYDFLDIRPQANCRAESIIYTFPNVMVC